MSQFSMFKHAKNMSTLRNITSCSYSKHRPTFKSCKKKSLDIEDTKVLLSIQDLNANSNICKYLILSINSLPPFR
jgi:predicted component of type VI protein secretion system